MRPANATVEVSVGERVYARSKLRYEDRHLEQGEVFALRGALNDKKLVGYGYVEKLDRKAETWLCSACGREFSSEGAMHAHQRRAHGGSG